MRRIVLLLTLCAFAVPTFAGFDVLSHGEEPVVWPEIPMTGLGVQELCPAFLHYDANGDVVYC